MKKIIKITSFVSILCFLSLTAAFSVQAADGFLNVSYNAETHALDVRSAGLLQPFSAVICLVSEGDTMQASTEKLPIVSDMFMTDTDGNLNVQILLTDSLKNGKYTVFIGSNSFEKFVRKTVLICIKDSPETNEALAKVNAANTAESFLQTLKSCGSNLGIDVEDESDFDEMSSVMFALKKEAGTLTLDEFNKSVNYARAAVMIQNGADIETVMQQYAAAFDTSYSDFALLTDDEKETVSSLMKKSNLKNERIDYDAIRKLAYVINVKGYGSLRDYVTENSQELGINLGGEYENLSDNNRAMLFKYMFNERNSYAYIDDVKNSFDTSLKKILKEDSAESSRHSGGASNAFSGSVTFSAEPALTVVPEEQEKSTPLFADIENYFAKDNIEFLAEKGIVNGFNDGTFRPNDNVTRAEACKMIALAFDIDASPAQLFDDVSEKDWFCKYVTALAQTDIVHGYGNAFGPDDFITRQDASLTMFNVLSFMGKTLHGDFAFDDSEDIAEYARESVSALAANGFLCGDGINFMPGRNITRGEISAIIVRLLAIKR